MRGEPCRRAAERGVLWGWFDSGGWCTARAGWVVGDGWRGGAEPPGMCQLAMPPCRLTNPWQAARQKRALPAPVTTLQITKEATTTAGALHQIARAHPPLSESSPSERRTFDPGRTAGSAQRSSGALRLTGSGRAGRQSGAFQLWCGEREQQADNRAAPLAASAVHAPARMHLCASCQAADAWCQHCKKPRELLANSSLSQHTPL